jgi:hypothetical protein
MVEMNSLYGGPSRQGLLANPRTVVEAAYLDPELPKFAGHPCIEALPLINTRERAMEQMLQQPRYSEEMRKAEAHIRSHMSMDIAHFFQPLYSHLKLEGMISRVLRDGYLGRNPLDPENSDEFMQRLEYFKSHPYAGKHAPPKASGFIICGMSGVGKSKGLERVISLYPQIVIHTNYRGRNLTRAQIVSAVVECPKDGSTKGLCQEFFRTIDYIMAGETDYSEDFGKDTQTTTAMMNSMAGIAKRLLLGVLIIDEIQYLNVAKSGGADEMLNFFVRLVNKIGIPVILVGTYDAIPLLTSTFRQARRGSGQGDFIWDPLIFSTDPKSDWQVYVESLWQYQYVRTKSPLTEKLSRALHDVSYGVVDLANLIYQAAQIRAIETKDEVITEGLLRSAYRDNFRLLSHIIETLNTGTPEMKAHIKDVHPPKLLPIQSNNTPGGSLTHARPGKTEEGAPGGDRENAAGAGAENNSAQRSPAASRRPAAASGQGGKRGKGRGGAKAGKAGMTYDDGDLRGIVAAAAAASLHPHKALLDAGVIRKPAEFLTNIQAGNREKEATS